MSNSKWKKLFSVINEKNLKLTTCVWKLIDENMPTPGRVPDLKMLGEDYVGDCGALNAPFEYNRIEWLLIPSKFSFRPYEHAPIQYNFQDIGQIKEQIDNIGKYEYEISEEGIKIFGYKP
jgi:hypothetical protein